MGMSRKVSEEELSELIEALKEVEDPRVVGRSKHLLIDILVLVVCGILCRAETIKEIAEFGHGKLEWLQRFCSLPHGIPSHDTISRVLFLIDPQKLEILFAKWVQSVLAGKATSISIDGKSSKGTDRRFNGGTRPLHLVSAYSHEHGLSLCQAASPSSGNAEADAAVECIKQLDLKGVTVTADAGLNSKKVINQIHSQKGHYIVPVKSNHSLCYAELETLFSEYSGKTSTSIDHGHGRHERRKCFVLSPKHMSARFREKWPSAKVVFAISRTRKEKDKRYAIQKTGEDGKQSYERNYGKIKASQTMTYYVSDKALSPQQALSQVRAHWGIENGLHWVLDVAFREDDWTVKAKRVARNLSLIRKMALNIIRANPYKASIRIKMKKAGWNDDYLEELVFRSKF
jgi:predicted transposase YbfD/YdcC